MNGAQDVLRQRHCRARPPRGTDLHQMVLPRAAHRRRGPAGQTGRRI